MRARWRGELAHSAAPGELRGRVSRACLSSISWPSIAPAARPIPMCSAIARSSSASPCATRGGSAPRASRPDTTPASCSGPAGAELHKARDAAKDQSYFLHAVDLARARRHADADRGAREGRGARAGAAGGPAGVRQARQHRHLLRRRAALSRVPRPLISPTSRARSSPPTASGWARTAGLAFYTLGQREGLRIGGRAGRAALPWFVARKDAARNALIVVQGHDHPLLCSPALLTSGPMHWLSAARREPFPCAVKVRYRQADQPGAARAARRRQRADRFRAAPAGGHARAVRGGVRGRQMPRRRRDRERRAAAASRAAA